jgi:glycylpeptide N-tetradecanoyltransferase
VGIFGLLNISRALKSPGWRKEWHVGVRASKSQRLVAFISGFPVSLQVRSNTLKCAEVNFLCIHKKLRSKRLTPVLIQEITRRCYVNGIYQAIYTGGIVLPKPVSSCRYFHRSLDWFKLYEVGFSHLPAKTTKDRQVMKYKLPSSTTTKNLRPMQREDVDDVLSLLTRYLKRFDMAPNFDHEEVEHWLLHDEKNTAEQVIWCYVVENPDTHKITDFFSFYCLESSVINNTKHPIVRAAYLFYYASEKVFEDNEKVYKERLNGLMNDALILAKQVYTLSPFRLTSLIWPQFNFDVFNALTLLDNPLFLEQQKFGPGDGQLHYYLFNYRARPIAGGVDAKNNVDDKKRGGIGVVML